MQNYKNMKVLVTGSEGLVGSSVIRVLKNSPKDNKDYFVVPKVVE